MEMHGPDFDRLHEANARSADRVVDLISRMITDWRVLLPALILAIGVGALGWQQNSATETFYREVLESERRLNKITEGIAQNSGKAIGRGEMQVEMYQQLVEEQTKRERLLGWIAERGIEAPLEVLDESKESEEK